MDSVYQEAIERFVSVMDRAQQLSMREPAAMTLATADAQGRPSARVVLLRAWDEQGFVFYTNSESRKGRQLAANPFAALCLHWEQLGEQIRVEGSVSHVTKEESDAYWSGRSRESQIGAWASKQSAHCSAKIVLPASSPRESGGCAPTISRASARNRKTRCFAR